MILLDTHVLLWWQGGGARLSVRASRAIAEADAVFVSPISCWEVVTLVARGRITLDREPRLWVRDLLRQDRIHGAALSPDAAAVAGTLPATGFPGDPADRFLYATARELVVPFVTKDREIRHYARSRRDVRTVW